MRVRYWILRAAGAALAALAAGGCSAVQDTALATFIGDLARGATAAWLL